MEENLGNIGIDENVENTSGQGESTFVPDDVANHFNWGAFLLSWIWGLGNKTYITLIILLVSFIPFVNLIVPLALCIWFGVEGNKWAWKNKRFESIEHFHSYQKKWVIAGLILPIVGLIFSLFVFALVMPVLMTDTKVMQSDSIIRLEKSRISETVQIKKALDKTCDLSSEGLAKCFEEDFANVTERSGDVLYLATGSKLEFTGDGYCEEEDACYVTITPKGASEEDSVDVNLYADENGFLYLDEEDEEKE